MGDDSNGNEVGSNGSEGSERAEQDPKRRAIMRARRGRTQETFWYTIAGYLLVTALTVVTVVIGVTLYSLPLDSGLLLLGLIVFSVLPYPAFALDSGYLKSMGSPWVPRTRRYAAAGIGVPILCWLIADTFFVTVEAIGIGLFSFLPITVVLSAFYLVRRHRHVGVP